MQTNEFIFTPTNPLQEAFIWNNARLSCMDGGVASSKTTAGLIRLLILASEFPRSRWVVFRQTYIDLTHTTRRTFKDKVCPRGWITRDVKELTTLANGAEITWMHLDAMTEQSLRGLEINGAFGDQVEEIDPELVDVIDSRLGRWQLPEWEERCPAYGWFSSNPKGHDSVYYRFDPRLVKYDRIVHFKEWDETQIAKSIELGFKVDPKLIPPSIAAYSADKAYFFGSSLINLPKLNEIDPGIVKTLLSKPESWKKQWVYGSRDWFEGSIHPRFSENIHVYDPDKFDPFRNNTRVVIAGFDYGLSSPTAYVPVMVDREGFCYAFDEYYAANKGISQHASSIKQKLETRVPAAIMADPTVFHEDTRDRRVPTGSIAKDYLDEGIAFLRADNNEHTSIEKIEELLHVDPNRMNPITRQLGSPRLFISKKCSNLIAEIQQQRRKEQRNPLTGEKEFLDERDDKVPDHAYDCLRYVVNSQYMDWQPFHGDIRIPSFNNSPKVAPARAGYAR